MTYETPKSSEPRSFRKSSNWLVIGAVMVLIAVAAAMFLPAPGDNAPQAPELVTDAGVPPAATMPEAPATDAMPATPAPTEPASGTY
jgi:hypothetical protein